MRGSGLERPPRWGAVTLVALVIANIAVFAYLGLRDSPATAAGPGSVVAAATTAAPSTDSPAVAPVTAAPARLLAVYGDGYASGNEQGGVGAVGWPALVAEQTGMTLALHAVPRSGYASPGATDRTLDQLVTDSPEPAAAVTVLFGSRNDQSEAPATVQANAAQAIGEARADAPGTVIVVIGPVWSDAAPPAGVLAARDAVQAAATEAGVTFLDPLAAAWFATGAGLISDDGVSPTDAGHQYLAGQIEPVVQTALEQATA